MKKLLRIIINIFIVLFFILFLSGLLYFITGSLEISPTEEQQAKVRLVSVIFSFFSAFLCFACIRIRMKLNNKQAD